jgi:hypothetical protein
MDQTKVKTFINTARVWDASPLWRGRDTVCVNELDA